jgi:iron complex outermembrane receptor protein
VPSIIRGFRYFNSAAAIFLMLALGSTAANASPKPFSIESEDAPRSLLEFGQQSALQILFASEKVKGIVTNAVHGNYEPIDALHLLLKGTPLVVSEKSDGVLVVEPQVKARNTQLNADPESINGDRSPTRLVQSATTSAQSQSGSDGPQNTNIPSSSVSSGYEKPKLDEIIVTAQKRTERLQDVPVSVTVVTPVQIDAQGLRSIDDMVRTTPAVTFQRVGATADNNFNDENSDISIRGIDSNAGTSTTGIYVDDTPIMTRHLSFGTVNPFPVLFDLDRVEVLRGPQGTLFGAGSEGGTLRFITPDPGLKDYSAYFRDEISTTAGGAPSYETAGAVGGPIIDGVLGFRLSASLRQDGGYVDRVSYNPGVLTANGPTDSGPTDATGTIDKNANWQRSETVRAALKWAVTDDLTVSPSVYYQQLYIHDTSVFWPSLSNNGQPTSGDLLNGASGPDSSHDPFYVTAIKVDWNLGSVALTSDTSYFTRRQQATTNYTPYIDLIYLLNPYADKTSTAYFTDKQRNFTEEVRLRSTNSSSPLSWVAGLFATNMYENTTETITAGEVIATVPQFFTTTPGLPYTPLPGGVIYFQDPYSEIDRQVALYGQADYKITPEIKLTAGVRVASDNTSGDVYFTGPFEGGTVTAGSNSFTKYPITPKFGLSYQPDSGSLYYASAAKGYRVGGFNTPGIGTDPLCGPSVAALGLKPTGLPSNYNSDSLWSYEVGTKQTLLDGHLQIDSSAFYIVWSQVQQAVFLSSCGLEFTANSGAAVSKGFDFDMHYRVARGLLLGIQGGYTDAYYTKTVQAGSIDVVNGSVVTAGDKLAPVPWTVALSAEYYLPGYEVAEPYFRVDYQYSASQVGLTAYQDPANGIHDATIPDTPATRNLSLRAGVRWGSLNLSLFSNNVLNSVPALTVARDTTYSSLYDERSWRPRTVGLTATYRF